MKSLIITTINNNNVIKHYIDECKKRKVKLFIIGDRKTPFIDSSSFFSIDKQHTLLKTNLAKLIPENHYSRKNIGYVLAKNSNTILETDDDNLPYESFWHASAEEISCPEIRSEKWINIYSFFSEQTIWPRGLSLNHIHNSDYSVIFKNNSCPIQQRLADLNPDVDAIFRFINKKDVKFFNGNYSLACGTFSPFNSQNTLWFKKVFPLLYLPTYCSFRMTDIYRSFIAQKILWTFQNNVLFSSPSVYQIRNEHNILSDFKEEVEGYLNIDKMIDILINLKLENGIENLSKNLLLCYQALINQKFFDKKELNILKSWLQEIT